jgi:hypothetical protein
VQIAGELPVDSITIDGLGEEDFRRSIESMLRHGQADAAAGRLRALIAPYAGEGEDKILPDRFLAVSSADITLAGWNDLTDNIGQYDRPGQRISALSVSFAEGDGIGRDKSGMLRPSIETNFFTDEAYPFSGSARGDLLNGYSHYQSEWQGNFEGTDKTLSVEGIDDLYGAVVRLETRLLENSEPSTQEICAGSLGACYLAVLLHQVVRDAVHSNGLPRPLCVMAGSSAVYPYFDAPVISCEECLEAGIVARLPIGLPPSLAETEEDDDAEDEDAEEEENAERAQSYGSLLSIGATMRHKKPVMVLGAADAAAGLQHYDVGAAHCLTLAGNSDRIGVLPGLGVTAFDTAAEWGEPEVPDELAASGLWRTSEPDDPGVEPVASDPSRLPGLPDEPDYHTYNEGPVLPEQTAAAVREKAELCDYEFPLVVGETGLSGDAEEARYSVALAVSEAPSVMPVSKPSSHSLRTRVVQNLQPNITPAGRLAAFLHHSRDWISRLWR